MQSTVPFESSAQAKLSPAVSAVTFVRPGTGMGTSEQDPALPPVHVSGPLPSCPVLSAPPSSSPEGSSSTRPASGRSPTSCRTRRCRRR